MIDATQIQRLQHTLNCLGYDCGKADGIKGPLFYRAMQVFTADHPEFANLAGDDRLQQKMLPLLDSRMNDLAVNNGAWGAKETAAFQAGGTALGIKTGAVDGIKGPKTIAALHQFLLSKEDFPSMQPSKQLTDDWQLTARQTGTAISSDGLIMAKGVLTLTGPSGEKHSFPFLSGGYGKYGNASMLPGLSQDVDYSSDSNATYALDWKSIIHNRTDLPGAMKIDGKGSWIRLGSDRSQTKRGGVIGKSGGGFFGIHTDGGVTGTQGCIGLSGEDAKAFFELLTRIPEAERPSALTVLPPQEQMEATLNLPPHLPAATKLPRARI